MKSALAVLAALATALPLAIQPVSAQSGGCYVTPPPIVLSPNLADPWVMQLTPGDRPIYRNKTEKPRVPKVEPVAAGPQPKRDPVRASASTYATDPRFLPQVVDYDGPGSPGQIVIDTNERFLYLVEEGGKARRYGVGVGRPGFEWAGTHTVTRKAEWPDWHPPQEMRKRQPHLPVMMPGGPKNPLGARALYLGSTLYRIHGTSEPWTIGGAVSSGCIRMRNEDVIDLYSRVKVGTRVRVI